MSSSRKWMPMYWGEYIADTTTLTAEQHGAYLLLIAFYWNHGKPLPDDPTALCRVARVHPKRWSRVWKTISRFFDLIPILDDQINNSEIAPIRYVWRHKRVDIELEKSELLRQKRQLAGLKGGNISRGRNNVERFVERNGLKQQGTHIQRKIRKKEAWQERQQASEELKAYVRGKGWIS